VAAVVVTAALRGEVPLGAGELEIDAADVFDLVRQLDAMHPGLRDFIESQVSIAVDGVLVSDWSTPLSSASEVLLVPHIAGGDR
jgi:molybdopterin converting factor small subunit